jgi:Family of unknown function (DUF5754)
MEDLKQYSNSSTVLKLAKRYVKLNPVDEIKPLKPSIKRGDLIGKLNNNAYLFVSDSKNKKYMIWNGNKAINFGQLGYEDFTKHNDELRRQSYINRASSIKGDWKSNPYSPNNLSIHLLWSNN